jgi:DNA-binding CsgD family transcriptional regulator
VDIGMLHAARDACAQYRWDVAYERYRDLAAEGDLPVADVAAFADASWWMGRTDESLTLSEQLYHRCLQGGEAASAARLAIEVGFLWLLRGEPTVGSGWIGRATRLLRDIPECAEHGYLRYLEVLDALDGGDADRAIGLTQEMQALANRHDDQTLCAIAMVYEGIATVGCGHIDDGLALIDEAMLPVRVGAVRPSWAGNLYCQLMALFIDLADVPRARAWTDATERWCDQHSNAAMFVGICRVHRAQLLHLEGAWRDAEQRAAHACQDLADMNVEVVAAGWYQIGELRRVQGDLDGAEQAFVQANELGRDPQPGLALVRLAQGRPAAAAAAVSAALAGVDQPPKRAPLLAAQVEVADAMGAADVGMRAARELTAIAEAFGTPGLLAAARQAAGTARLLAAEPDRALPLLRDACQRWRELGARYDAARVRELLARTLAAVGDADTAAREHAAAQAVFQDLGAALDLAGARGARIPPDPPGGLTPREVEVLQQVADGCSNADIATSLTISERTVERHVSNIFLKLEVSSRIDAARFAFANGLVELE